jgi:hypothetical protein
MIITINKLNWLVMTKGKIIIRKERAKKGKGTSEEKQKEIVKQAIIKVIVGRLA